ncbi:uncharacterized protein AMSG_04549 [Thecamonas trahens ATCC 50062]|uniref:Phospholipid-transporting ATPase n=1 Tax=Thecamonas trahens ATCC 50062 TaxID=461836 RepID=A0A0L0DAI9_THETB|nr:hypothetical protein AMSG_04549 [Thecamonas trahens ATCC 50062]KNC48318.1 hypothetical protein AMSG_04549 [Thecamonas trahens ATCC 50062]|eukprot:XP_013758885.1 hypothetical protein AMSG_04549 [Thecamonas trahens ATCC 50062]
MCWPWPSRGVRVAPTVVPRKLRMNDREYNDSLEFNSNYTTTSKYTVFNFVPKNLWEQFHRIANVYFLFIAVLQQIPGVSPLGTGTVAMTLAIVLMFTAIKEALEDYHRHVNDRVVNQRQTIVVRNGVKMPVRWQDLVVGDIVNVTNKQFFPADIMVIASSGPQGMCYIETSNLDGESNLKIRQAPPATASVDLDQLLSLRAELECDPPNSAMYSFNGVLRLLPPHHFSASVQPPPASHQRPPLRALPSAGSLMQFSEASRARPQAATLASGIKVTNQQILLRDSQLRNTAEIYGLVVYTGRDTKIMKSSNRVRMKQSRVERLTNRLIIGMFILEVSLCLVCAVGNSVWLRRNTHSAHYLALGNVNPRAAGALSFLTFVILFSTLIPISLYVSMETVKFGQSKLIDQDITMYYPPKDTPAMSRTSSLNEELGQVQYIFSDKTGTLTQNYMAFKACSINGVAYGADTAFFVHAPSQADHIATHVSHASAKHDASDSSADSVSSAHLAPPKRTSHRRRSSSSAATTSSSSSSISDPPSPHTSSKALAGTLANTPQGLGPGDEPDNIRAAASSSSSSSSSPVSDSSTAQEAGRPSSVRSLPPGRINKPAAPRIPPRNVMPIQTISPPVSARRAVPPRVAPTLDGTSHASYAESQLAGQASDTSSHTLVRASSSSAIAHNPTNETSTRWRRQTAGQAGASPPPPRHRNLQGCSLSSSGASLEEQEEASEKHHASYGLRDAGPQPANCPLLTGRPIPHVVFDDDGDRLKAALLDPETGDAIREFAELLGVCHTVIPEIDFVGGNDSDDDVANDDANDGSKPAVIYQAASPDEGALVNAAKMFGYEFHTRTPSSVTVSVFGQDVEYPILAILPFTSARKRSSVVVQRPNGEILVLTKGADVVVMELLDSFTLNNSRIAPSTQSHLDRFAAQGLRTLVVAKRVVSPGLWASWSEELDRLENLPESSEKSAALAAIYDDIESELVLVGATAIEDKLQDGVPEALATLREAGIKVWVLTGDKQETAIMIGYSCQLLTPNMQVIVLNASEEAKVATNRDELDRVRALLLSFMEDQVAAIASAIDGPEAVNYAVVIDGYTMRMILGEPGSGSFSLFDRFRNPVEEEDMLTVRLREAFLDLAVECVSVIGCRVSPAQKAQMVRFVQAHLDPVSLAIGDGANDVDMIREANIGIGISGEEGGQAALAADYALAQFRFLLPLLLVHGHWCYHRISTLIFYCFYKNMALTLIPFWFVFFNGFSGQTFVERWTIAMYNTLFTALPIITMGLYDQVLRRTSLLQYPKLYYRGQDNKYFDGWAFASWVASAVFHSIVFFFFVEAALAHNVHGPDGRVFGLFSNGVHIFTAVVIAVNLKAALELSTWNIVTVSALAASLVLYFGWLVGFSYVASFFRDAVNMYFVGTTVIATPTFWFLGLLVPVLALLPDYTLKYLRRWYYPEPADIVKELKVTADDEHIGIRAALQAVHTLLQTVVPVWPDAILPHPSGFAFEAEPEGHIQAITDPTNGSHGRNAAVAAPAFARPHVGTGASSGGGPLPRGGSGSRSLGVQQNVGRIRAVIADADADADTGSSRSAGGSWSSRAPPSLAESAPVVNTRGARHGVTGAPRRVAGTASSVTAEPGAGRAFALSTAPAAMLSRPRPATVSSPSGLAPFMPPGEGGHAPVPGSASSLGPGTDQARSRSTS